MSVQRVSRLSGIRRLAKEYGKNRYLALLFLPTLLYLAVFKYAPLAGILMAFKNYKMLSGIMASEWVGLAHFESLITLRSFLEVFRNTLIISISKLVFSFPAPILFALMLSELRGTRLKKTVQTISYMPHFVSWVVLGGLFRQFLSPTIGPINQIIRELGGDSINFLANVVWFRPVLVATTVWKGFGWGSIVYLAAISGVDPQLYEAAEIDGAGRVRRMFSITLPSIVPVMTIMLIFSIGGIVNDDFDQIFNLYNDAVYSVGDVLSTYTYRIGMIELRYDFSTAVGLFRNVIAFFLIILTNTITKRINEYGIW